MQISRYDARLGEDIAREIYQDVKQVLARLQVTLSDKEEANKPFSTRFDALGAVFDTMDFNDIKMSPTERSIGKAETVAALFESRI